MRGNVAVRLAMLAALLCAALPARAAAPVLAEVQTTPNPAVEGAPVGLSAAATDADPGAVLEYRWDFGDGTPLTAWNPSPLATHTFATRGSYRVFAQVRDEGGLTHGLETNLLVTRAGAPATQADQDRLLRLRSSPVVVDAAARRVWVANPDSDTVTVLDADTLAVLFETSVGRHPMNIALDPSGRAWVACRDSDEIRVLNGSGAGVQTIPLARGSRPVAVVPSLDGGTVFATEYATGRVRRFNAVTFADGGSIYVGPTPQAMAVTADGLKLLVARFISPGAGGIVRTIDISAFTRTGDIVLQWDQMTVDTDKAGRGIPNYVAGLSPDAAGAGAWYVAKKDNIFRGITRDGQVPTFETVVRAMAARLDISRMTEDFLGRVDIDDVSQPSSVLVDPSGVHVLITLQGNNAVVVLNAPDGKVLARADVGAAPQGVAIDAATRRIFVQNFMGRSVTVFDGTGLLLQGTRRLDLLATVPTVGTELLSPKVLQGKRLFYSAADPRLTREGYISCALCHQDGGHDGRIWDFTDRGEGMRNTITLKGAGKNQGRVHWTGNFDEIQDFEHDIRQVFGGTGLLSDSSFHQGSRDTPLGDSKAGLSPDLDALAAYVSSLKETDPSPFKNPDGSLTAAAVAGKLIFQRQNCALCHNGPAFTDSEKGQLHDVGTSMIFSGERLGGFLEGFDTPTLKGLWDTGNYLHSGAAPELTDVMIEQDSAKHGRMDQLTAQERSDLAAYLLSLDDDENGPPAAGPVVKIQSVEPFAGGHRVRIQAAPSVTAVELRSGGSSLGAAALQADGSYLRTVTLPAGPVELTARAVRGDGGATISKEFMVGEAGPRNDREEVVKPTRPGLLTPGTSDGNNDVIDFGPDAEQVHVWDSRGREVFQAAGGSLSWDGRSGGRPVPSGLYIAKVMEKGGAARYRKILIVK